MENLKKRYQDINDGKIYTFSLEDTLKDMFNFSDFIGVENDSRTFDLRETDNKLCHKGHADTYRKDLSRAAKSTEDVPDAFVWYTLAKTNQLKDVNQQVMGRDIIMQMEKDHIKEQQQKLQKSKDEEAQDQRKMIDHLKKKIKEVENENKRMAEIVEMIYRTRNECKSKLDDTMMQRFLSVTDKLQGAEQKVFELTKNIEDQNRDKETAAAKLDKLEKENEYLVNQLRSNEIKMELLNNSHETERKKHESAMKCMHARCSENEIELEKHKNAHFNLLLQLDRVHNYSRISMEETALFDKTFIEQKLEDERVIEEDLAEVTTNVIKKFASAKDRHGVIKSFKKRIEKGSSPSLFGNDFLSDEDSHMERFPTALHEHKDNKQYNERLEESKTTKNCHNKTEKNTNVFNISMNIAKSNVSFIDKKEERTLRLNGGNSDHKAIEGKDQL